MSEREPDCNREPEASDAAFNRWNAMLEKIKNEVTRLLVNRHIFWEVQEIIKANTRIQKPSSFYEWMGNVYATDAVIGVRKQIDLDKRSVSFARLLTDMAESPGIFSRDRFLAMYNDKSNPELKAFFEKQAHRDFEKFAQPGSSHIDSALVMADLTALKEKSKNLQQYANKRVAHLDEAAFDKLPTFHELNECLDFLEGLVKKYMLLFRATNYRKLIPTWQYDWKVIFREPWIKGTTEPKVDP